MSNATKPKGQRQPMHTHDDDIKKQLQKSADQKLHKQPDPQKEEHQKEDREIDEELKQTFPASDPSGHY